MAKRSPDEVRSELRARGLHRGASVSWQGSGQMRYGCVMETSDYDVSMGRLRVVACNGQHLILAVLLTPAPSITDPVMADYRATYPELASNG
jgi:hypothetical protein